jgi:hypothetical protein
MNALDGWNELLTIHAQFWRQLLDGWMAGWILAFGIGWWKMKGNRWEGGW